MIDFPNNNDADYRFQINDPERFKKTYESCQIILKDYPKELEKYKKEFIVNIVASFINLGCFGAGWLPFGWFIGIGIYLLLGIFFGCWQIKRREKLLKEANYVKEKLDFIISYNSSPLKGDEWKGARNPWNPFL